MDRIRLCLIILTIISCFGFTSCNSFKSKNYEISYSGSDITVTIPMPTIGVSRIGETTYDGFTLEDIEKEIYDKLRGSDCKGTYHITLIIKFKDEYGNYSETESLDLKALDADEVKKYAAYRYFRGKITSLISKAVHNRPTITFESNTESTRHKDEQIDYPNETNNDYMIELIRNATYYNYHNSRFDFHIAYPSFLIAEDEPTNGDGRRFSMNSKILLSVSGINNVNDETIESKYYENDVQSAVYSILKENWYIISGYSIDGRIFYQKTVLYNDVFMTAILYYPPEYKKEFDVIIKRIFTNFPH